MGSAVNTTQTGKPSPTSPTQEPRSSSRGKTPAATAADLASKLHTLHDLSPIPTPAQPGPSSPAELFPLNSEMHPCEKVNNRIIEQGNFGIVMPLSAYHCARFYFNHPKNSKIYVLLGHLAHDNQSTPPLNLNIPNNFIQMMLVDGQVNGTPINTSFHELQLEALIKQLPYGAEMSTSYSVLPKNLNQTDHADLIHAFTHSLCLTGVRYMATQAAQALATHWPGVKIKNILDAGFSIGRHHPLLRHVFPHTQKITAVDCQHCPEINDSMVSIEQVQTLLHEKDQYVIGYAQKYGIPKGTDIILIRNLEVQTAPGAWADFFGQTKNNTDWKALLVSCSSTAIFQHRLKPLIDKHFKSDAFEIIHCGENPEAQRIHINHYRPEIGENCTRAIGPDAFCAIIVRKNPEQNPGRQTNPANLAGPSTTGATATNQTGVRKKPPGLKRGFFK